MGFAMKQLCDQDDFEQQIADLKFVNQVAFATNTAFHIDDLLQSVSSTIITTTDWERVVIGLLEMDATLQVSVANRPQEPDTAMEGLYANAYDFALISEVLKLGLDIRVLQQDESSTLDDTTITALREAGFQSVLAVLLRHDDRVFGALLVGSSQTHAIFPNETAIFQQVGTLVSQALSRIYYQQKMEQINTMKSSFLARVTHELRTPATSIIGFVEAMDRLKFGTIPTHLEEPLNYVLHSSIRLKNLVNDLLDYAKIDAGHFSIDLEPVDIEPIIHNVVGMLQPQIQERGLQSRVEIGADLPPIIANKQRFDQVLTNLMSNAVKFTEKGSVTVQAERKDNRVILSVQDTGIGITTENQALIFEEFHQIKDEQSVRFDGTGLGLAITRRLVELMGGKMSLQSTFGEGATFSCDFLIAHPE